MVRGDTGAPVAGAAVTLDGASYVADSEGRVRVGPAPPAAFLDVTAAGMLDRRTTVGRTPIDTIVLWPRSTATGIDEDFTATVVYTRAILQGTGPHGADQLHRIPADAVKAFIVLTPDILADEFAHAAHVTAVARLNAAARGAVTFELVPEVPQAWPIFTARVVPDDPVCASRVLAFVRYSLRGNDIVGGEIVYCSRVAPHRLALVVHELGHTFGLQHSLDPRDMMFSTINAAHAEDFRPREVEVMALMTHRRAGNRFPDSDVGLPTAAAAREEVIACR